MLWKESPVDKPGILQIDHEGWQSWHSVKEPTRRVIILGGSVAFGAYASRESAAYFHLLGRKLEERRLPVSIRVLSSGAWKSPSELVALSDYAEPFDLAVFVNGLNDLTITHDGDHLEPGDMPNRSQHYLMHMRRAAEICRERGAAMLVVLQPCLYERANPTSIERELIRTAYSRKDAPKVFRTGYRLLRDGLAAMAELGDIRFFDASKLFDDEKATSFCDVWHFTDALHAILAERLADQVQPLLAAERPDRNERLE